LQLRNKRGKPAGKKYMITTQAVKLDSLEQKLEISMIFEFSAIGAGTPIYGHGSEFSALEYAKYLNLGRVRNFYESRRIPASEAGCLVDLNAFVDFMGANRL
jgi:hypothetical protein